MVSEQDNFIPEELAPGKKPEEGMLSFVWEVSKFVFLAVIIVVPIRVFIAQPYVVSGASMVPTFESGDYLIVDQLSYRFESPERGDIIIFRYPIDQSKFFIKRVIGLPNETVSIKDGKITIINETSSKNETTINEPYLRQPFSVTMTVKLKGDEYFVMGDNRGASLDSRSWGPLQENLIVGRALVRLFPFTEASYLPGIASY